MPEKAEIIARTVIDSLTLSITIAPDEKVEIGASIGISYYKGAMLDKIALIRQADIAMYEVKRHGRNAYRVFSCFLKRRFPYIECTLNALSWLALLHSSCIFHLASTDRRWW